MQIPRKNGFIIEINGNATTTRYYPEDGIVPESLGFGANPKRIGAPKGRLTGVRMRLATEAGAAASVRLQVYQEVNGQLTDDHLVYDSGVLTDGVDGIVLAASATTAFWLDSLAADQGVFGPGAFNNASGVAVPNSREGFLAFVLTQVGAAGLNQYAVAFDTLEDT
jgi:hypothetical protein